MSDSPPIGAPLAELHLHLYGCIRPAALLDIMAAAEPQWLYWGDYEKAMLRAYGAIPPTRELLERYRRNDPKAQQEFEEFVVMNEMGTGNFARFLARSTLPAVASIRRKPGGATPAEIAAEVAAMVASIRSDHERQGIAYAEFRCMLGSDLRTEEHRTVVDALLTEYAEGTTERLVLSLDRTDPWPGWERVQELALGPYGHVLVGVDFCGIEEGHPPKEVAELFASIGAFNRAHPDRALAILHHVGESFADKSLESAVRWVQEAAELGAHRLGHAIALGVDPAAYGTHERIESVSERRDQIMYDLQHAAALGGLGVRIDARELRGELADLASLPPDAVIELAYDETRLDEVRLRQYYAITRVRATGAVVEVCPTSNRRIGAITDPAHHPVHRFHAEGLPFVVSSDNPGIFGTSLLEEVDWVCAQIGGGVTLRDELLSRAWRSRSEVLSARAQG
ncbi:hypothetical protein IU500_17510 [Nocardia terpenica]|uniref:hypothetical protein n=1 Tax=Nocardia terpenica TaxID=455432 RepID=UPI0018961748|nr:hypothetical protein [Nocardia terpenica]MBF6063283.1 hypothetical protein [Nocardia terpenica]MBF6105839.1 hypothetical protein [Nocardia terpenica]MBF6113577.1 hypothetical protein [Nocardia terpenica]MBF6119580.1 hypothetical protein [Nocardia terpenica]MBF6151991.1 hypothetical protein [Nocardia terpenica]